MLSIGSARTTIDKGQATGSRRVANYLNNGYVSANYVNAALSCIRLLIEMHFTFFIKVLGELSAQIIFKRMANRIVL